MNVRKIRIIHPSPEGDEEINRQIAEYPDEAERTDGEWADAMNSEELSPGFAGWARERRAALEAGLLEHVTITPRPGHHRLVQGPGR